VSMRFNLKLDPERSRCPICGAELKAADREAVRGKVPTRTLKAYEDFWICTSCGQVYWKGSHWKSILEMVEEATGGERP
ncbi:MAG: Mut7-C RNAse domain-containing protein, partial [Candidatus Bathyarchaeia archaeon]